MIDVFAGCAGLGVICDETYRHCVCVEGDPTVYEWYLSCFKTIELASNIGEEDIYWDQYDPDNIFCD